MKSNVRIKLGKKIKQLRKDCGYTQEKLSVLSGIDYKYIQKIEGKTPPGLKIDSLEKLAKAFKISLSQMLNF